MIAVRRFSMTLSLEAKYAEIQWHILNLTKDCWRGSGAEKVLREA